VRCRRRVSWRSFAILALVLIVGFGVENGRLTRRRGRSVSKKMPPNSTVQSTIFAGDGKALDATGEPKHRQDTATNRGGALESPPRSHPSVVLPPWHPSTPSSSATGGQQYFHYIDKMSRPAAVKWTWRRGANCPLRDAGRVDHSFTRSLAAIAKVEAVISWKERPGAGSSLYDYPR